METLVGDPGIGRILADFNRTASEPKWSVVGIGFSAEKRAVTHAVLPTSNRERAKGPGLNCAKHPQGRSGN
jgi:hypothetical protein